MGKRHAEQDNQTDDGYRDKKVLADRELLRQINSKLMPSDFCKRNIVGVLRFISNAPPLSLRIDTNVFSTLSFAYTRTRTIWKFPEYEPSTSTSNCCSVFGSLRSNLTSPGKLSAVRIASMIESATISSSSRSAVRWALE
jgi:hypothetical protein